MSKQSQAVRLGEQAFGKVDKVNAELVTLTYGSMVTQLLKDYEDVDQVNAQLLKMGYNIGVRLVEEFLSVSGVGRCHDLTDTAEVIAKIGFKMFLGVAANVANWSADKKEFSIVVADNPLTDFVELPDHFAGLDYSNVLCGVINGALEMVQLSVESKIVKSVLRGDDHLEIRIIFREYLADEVPVGDD
jgi:trafficking protein particle complex subunit 3